MKNYITKRLCIPIMVFIFSFSLNAQINQNIIPSIDSIMKANYPQGQPGASVIVFKDRQLLFKSAYGMADLEKSIPITPETIFRIGSMTKQFTAIGILILLSENKLSLDDPISKYYPGLFNNKPRITIKHLLSHTSGLTDVSRIRAIRPMLSSGASPYEVIKLISKEDINFEPGDQYDYSNSGYFILGGILESVSGKSYKEFLTERIFKPLKMKNTYYENRDGIQGDLTLGYFSRQDSFSLAPDINSSIPFAAGGLWSTVEDMARWNEALYCDKLVEQKYIRMAFTPNELNNSRKTDYGFGFRSCKVNGINSIEHGGGVFGYNCYGIRVESKGVYVLLLTNFERNNNFDEVAATIAALVSDQPFDHSSYQQAIDIEIAKEYIGEYLTERGDTISVSFENNKIFYLSTRGKRELIRIEGHTFLLGDSIDDRLKFNLKEASFALKPRRSMAIKANKI